MTQVVGRPAVTRRRRTKTSYSPIWRELEDDDDGTDRPQDRQLGVPPSKAELEEGRSCGKMARSEAKIRAGLAFWSWFHAIPAPSDAVPGLRQSGQRLGNVEVHLLFGGVAGIAYSGSEQ